MSLAGSVEKPSDHRYSIRKVSLRLIAPMLRTDFCGIGQAIGQKARYARLIWPMPIIFGILCQFSPRKHRPTAYGLYRLPVKYNITPILKFSVSVVHGLHLNATDLDLTVKVDCS